MRIQHNIMAMNAYRNYNNNTSALAKNLEKLSSGYRINRAGDDAAGLAISEKMRAQITALGTAQKNVKDGISLVKTAEGATQEIHDMLNRMVDLATQSANGTYQNEVDRQAIQDEYTALKTEINRIADASNFNGIKLLDGSLGLNSGAFKMDSAAAVEASDGPLSADFVATEAETAKWHTEGESVTAATPSAKIDLGDLKVNVAAGATGTVAFNIGGTTYNVSLSNAAGATAKDFTADDIGGLLIAQLNTGIASASGNTTTGQDAMKIGDAAFKATNNGGVITLAYNGTKTDGTTYKAETTFSGNAAAAAAINSNLGFDVSATVTGGTKTGDVVHKATEVAQAAAEVAASKAGIDIKMDAGMVVNGGTLEIDGKKFYFQTDAAKDPAITGATKIDVSKAKTDAERVHMAADLLSKQAEFAGQDGRKWKIGVNGDGTSIHIDQTASSTAGKELKTYEGVAGVVKANGVATAAKGAGTKITVTNANVKEGDGLTIDGKLYVFADKSSTTIPDGAVKVAIKGGAGKNLADAISGSEYDAATNTVTVRGTVGGTAPSVLGRGLNLQIGEDSQSYNQLSVSITDMHTKTLGLDDVNLDTQTNAQAAVKVIKDAINSVSSTRGKLGATQNRLEHTANNLSTMKENIQDAEATIRDTDIAEEMMAYTKNNILVQSAQAMLAQANQIPQGVLQLLG